MTSQTSNNSPTSEDLTQVIEAYNTLTQRLQKTHEQLSGEVVRLRRELASTNVQLQRSKRLAALGEMASGIAHEIRNPLAAIHLYAGMLQEDLAPMKPQQEIATKIGMAVRGLESVVLDVLTFSHEMRPDIKTCNVLEVFAQAIDLQKPAILQNDILVDDQGVDQSMTVEMDPQLMHRALTNIIRNAIEAMAGQPDSVLMLSANMDTDQQVARLIIADKGCGIAEEDIDRIFNPFFTTRNTGTGLGLAIVHRIMDAHGGSILVHNDQGAVFELVLPMSVHASQSPNTNTHLISEKDTAQGVLL